MAPNVFDSPSKIISVDAEDVRCPHGIGGDWGPLPILLREKAMLQMINAITDKPAWHEKVFDDTIAAKWKSEAHANVAADDPSHITEAAADWCIAELRDKAEKFKESGFVPVLDVVAKVIKGDFAIESALRDELQKACEPLQDLPKQLKDYHPRSEDQVVNLVHPSLFPLIYGSTKVLENGIVTLDNFEEYMGKGQIIPVPEVNTEFYSKKFQWLPCTVRFQGNKEVKITSYINNLHPLEHPNLYLVLEKFIAKSIPLWNSCLMKRYTYKDLRRIPCWEQEWDLPEPEWESPPPSQEQESAGEESVDSSGSDWDYGGPKRAKWSRERRAVIPDMPIYAETEKPWDMEQIDLRRDFADRGLQVIVKLASIELTPEKPIYEGGSWHLEGMLNERIAATAIYYYDSQNVTENELQFRTLLDTLEYGESESRYGKEIDYPQVSFVHDRVVPAQALQLNGDKNVEQSEFEGLERIFGLSFGGDEPALQDLGNVVTREGRLLAFPNTLQHRVSPLRLTDPTKPGHRRILVLWLIDPHVTIPSTAIVPPQQREWWSPKVLEAAHQLADLPAEVSNMIFNNVDDDPMSLKRAKELRLELMDERSRYSHNVNEEYRSQTYFFCEH